MRSVWSRASKGTMGAMMLACLVGCGEGSLGPDWVESSGEALLVGPCADCGASTEGSSVFQRVAVPVLPAEPALEASPDRLSDFDFGGPDPIEDVDGPVAAGPCLDCLPVDDGPGGGSPRDDGPGGVFPRGPWPWRFIPLRAPGADGTLKHLDGLLFDEGVDDAGGGDGGDSLPDEAMSA